jgi:hypothetical protein
MIKKVNHYGAQALLSTSWLISLYERSMNGFHEMFLVGSGSEKMTTLAV